jgi:hypothetical protein
MNSHLSERDLVEYQFELASDVRQKEIAEHLQDCPICWEHLERLKRKFSSLELLRQDVKVSEDLIRRIAEQAGRAAQPRFVTFRKAAWFSSVAAVFIIGLLLITMSVSVTKRQRREITETFTSQPVEEKLNAKREIMREDMARSLAVEKASKPASMRAKRLAGTAGELAAGIVASDEIMEQPPFAPASAIELVTLPRRENVQLTIYNSADLTLVRERRDLTLKRGWNWLQFMWANTLIDPTSLNLTPLDQADKIDIKQLVFPARLQEVGRWLIRSEVDGRVPFEITYFTSGLSWRAFYMGTLSQDEKTMRLEGYVRVDNGSGEDYEDAQTRLIVGKVHILDEIAELARRRYPYGRPGLEINIPYGFDSKERRVEQIDRLFWGRAAGIGGKLNELRRKEIIKEGLSEYFLYTIEGMETIPDKWGKRLLSFEADDVPVKSLYKYDQQRWGDDVIRYVAFANDEEHKLGQTPIPNGTVKIYSQADDKGYLSYVGGTSIKYVPVNEEIELNLGPARLVKVEPILIDFTTDNYIFNKEGNITGWDETRTWKIEITNTKKLPIEVEITRDFETAYWKLQFGDTNVSYEKHDATHARFKLIVSARSKRAFEYKVTIYHGVREETLTK